MTLGHDRSDDAPERESQSGSWVELFPFVLMAVVMLMTIVAIAIGGDS